MKKHSTSEKENLFGGTVEGLFIESASPDTHFGKLLRIGKKQICNIQDLSELELW